MGTLILQRCNIYGAETGGINRGQMLGGLSSSKPSHQWYCEKLSTATYRMECAHGHRGQLMPLCEKHAKQLITQPVTFCPACNTNPDSEDLEDARKKGHKCKLTLTERS